MHVYGLIYMAAAAAFSKYGPSYFDGRLDPKARADVETGFLKDHNRKRSFEGFGDLSLVTYSMETSNDLQKSRQEMFLKKLLESTHATALTLQSVKKSTLDMITSGTLGHYGVVHNKEGSRDIITAAVTYLPIIYDTYILNLEDSGMFRPVGDGKLAYASWARFRYKNSAAGFTIINLDLFSASKDTVEKQLLNIISDIRNDSTVASAPVFLMGVLNSVSARVEKLMDTQIHNVLKFDTHSRDAPLYTFRISGDIINNTERDYILLRDFNNRVAVNYASILRESVVGPHYPIHAIVSFNNLSPVEVRMRK
jgi:hypothetical protein